MYKISDNPFEGVDNLKSDFYKNLIDGEGGGKSGQNSSGIEEVDYEEVTERQEPVPSKEDDPFLEEERAAYKLLDSNTKGGFGKEVDRILNLREVDKVQNAKQVSDTFSQLFKDLNDQYGLDIKFDMDSFTNTLSYIIKPKNMKAVEVYISEAYSRTRAVLYLLYLKSIGLLSQQILDPKFIMSNSMSYQDKLILMRELFSYIQSLDDIYERVKVEQSDIKLRKLAEDEGQEDVLSDPTVKDFLETLVNSVKSK